MPQAKPLITTARADAYLASVLRLLAWLFGVTLRLSGAGRSARLQRLLSRAERAVECVLFLKAVALYGAPPPRRRCPRAAPSGFRRTIANRRSFMKSVKVRARKANALTRVIALVEALAHPQAAVAYFFRQICKGLRGSHLVAVAPPADSLPHDASVAACGCCDSS